MVCAAGCRRLLVAWSSPVFKLRSNRGKLLEEISRRTRCPGRNTWHLAAVIAGVRFGMDGAVAIVNRSALFEADVMLSTVEAGLPPDETQTEAIGRAAATLPPTGQRDAPLLGASLGVLPGSTMMANVGPCVLLAAAGLLHLACPLLTGASALGGETRGRSRPGPSVSGLH